MTTCSQGLGRLAGEAGRALGVGVAALAPGFMTIGLNIWSRHFKGNGGHAYMLNLLKCSACTPLFLIGTLAAPNWHCWTPTAVGMLLISSFLGIVIGDTFWLEAMELLGVRQMIFVDALKPFAAALIAWRWGGLNETPTWLWAVGAVLTVGAVAGMELATSARRDQEATGAAEATSTAEAAPAASTGVVELRQVGGHAAGEPAASAHTWASIRGRGYVFAALNVGFDALGTVLTKAYAGGLGPFAISFVRFGFAAAVLPLPIVCRAVYRAMRPDAVGGGTARRVGAPKYAWHEVPPNLGRRVWGLMAVGFASTTFVTPVMNAWCRSRVEPGARLAGGLRPALRAAGPDRRPLTGRPAAAGRSSRSTWPSSRPSLRPRRSTRCSSAPCAAATLPHGRRRRRSRGCALPSRWRVLRCSASRIRSWARPRPR